jgi:stage V sporulation protein B
MKSGQIASTRSKLQLSLPGISPRMRRFLCNVCLLTGASLLLRTIGLRFNLYLTEQLGGAGMGLIELVLSVYSFALTFSSAGVHLAASKLSAEELGRGSGNGVRAVMRRCIGYSLVMGCLASGALLLFAPWIGVVWLGDAAAIPALRHLAFSLPCTAVSAALGGYFSAVRRVGKNALGQILEIGTKIAVTVLLLRIAGGDLEAACLCVVWGMTASEVLGCVYQSLLFAIDLKKQVPFSGTPKKGLTRSLLSITLPVALSSYIRSGLLTLEHMLIPRGLRRYGASYEESLASYGVLSSMAMPILFFPASLLYAANSLLIPEIARGAGSGDTERIRKISRALIRFTLFFAIGAAALLICFSRTLGDFLYEDARVGYYLGLLAPLIPVMYLDSAVDALLKGLGEQIFCMGVNIADAALSALLVFFLVPRFGVEGYIGVIILSELLNASLSVGRLSLRVDLAPRLWKWVGAPLAAAVGATCGARIAVSYLFSAGNGVATLGGGAVCLLLYVGLTVLLCGGEIREKEQQR